MSAQSLVERARSFGIELYLNPGTNQLLSRQIDPVEANPRPLPQDLASEINNSRGAIVQYLRPLTPEQELAAANRRAQVDKQQAALDARAAQEHEALAAKGEEKTGE